MRLLKRPTVRWELISCAVHGHMFVGTDAKKVRKKDEVYARESDGLRLYRCLRCGSWNIKRPPVHPKREYPPEREDIDLPIRGRLLRDRYVLRLIAVDRGVHVVILTSIATLIILFATHQASLKSIYFQVLQAFQGVNGGLTYSHGLVNLLQGVQGVFDFKQIHILEVGILVIAFAALEAVEMVGLWRGRRWAEYLTFVATILFIPYEIFELSHGLSIIKVGAFAINVAIAVYLLYAKRLFGVNGGVKGEAREKQHDSGWSYFDRTSPTPR